MLKANGMFHTPNDTNELLSWIEEHKGQDRIHVMTAAMMAWNLAAKIVNEGIDSDDESV